MQRFEWLRIGLAELGVEFNFYKFLYLTGVMDVKTIHFQGHQSANNCLAQPQMINSSLTFEPQKYDSPQQIELCGKSQQNQVGQWLETRPPQLMNFLTPSGGRRG